MLSQPPSPSTKLDRTRSEELILFNILPRLSSITLSRLKYVSKKWHAVISDDPYFDEARQRFKPTTTYLAMDSAHNKTLVFIPTTSHINQAKLPDVPTTSLITDNDVTFQQVVSSSNGLLLCKFFDGQFPSIEFFYCLFDPSTSMLSARIPNPNQTYEASIGLATNLSKAPGHYLLVAPFVNFIDQTYEFKVLLSYCNNKWIDSHQTLTVDNLCERIGSSRVVYANGVLYWDCTEYLLWYDCENLCVGCADLPMPELAGLVEIGVCEDRVTCAKITCEMIQLWMMDVDNCTWKKTYSLPGEKIVQSLVAAERLFPLPYGGGDLILIVARQEKKIVGYNMRTGTISEVFKGMLSNVRFFDCVPSMTALLDW